jgi:hypothetical protein
MKVEKEIIKAILEFSLTDDFRYFSRVTDNKDELIQSCENYLENKPLSKQVIYVVWGTQANDDFAIGKVVKTNDNCDGHAKRYEFDTEAEKDAFIKGVEEAQGWQEAIIVKASEVVITEKGIQQ